MAEEISNGITARMSFNISFMYYVVCSNGLGMACILLSSSSSSSAKGRVIECGLEKNRGGPVFPQK